MASWPGTAATTICMLTLVSRLVKGLTQVSPGSRRPGRARPKRKTMPFSYCVMTLKPNIAAVLSLGAWRAGPARNRDGAGVTAGVRNALGPLFSIAQRRNYGETPLTE